MNNKSKQLLRFFNEGKYKFFEKEKDNILSGISERNLCGRLGVYLESLLENYELQEYFCDIEYNRKQDGKIKTVINDEYEIITINCDLIVHSRGKFFKEDNLVAIEMKKATRPEEEKISDRNRLVALTKQSYDGIWSYDGKTHPEHVCGYDLGIFFEIDIENQIYTTEFFADGNKEHEEKGKF